MIYLSSMQAQWQQISVDAIRGDTQAPCTESAPSQTSELPSRTTHTVHFMPDNACTEIPGTEDSHLIRQPHERTKAQQSEGVQAAGEAGAAAELPACMPQGIFRSEHNAAEQPSTEHIIASRPG